MRHKNHKIDTLSVRKIFSTLSEDWLVRNIDERDYGIDLMMEYFDVEYPTGNICYVQVKGKSGEFPAKNISLSGFPVKTVKYALLFEAPFFVFHTSLDSNRTVFVWLQKYAQIELDHKKKKNWKHQKTVTIKFPDENVLDADPSKLISFLDRHSVRPDGIRMVSYLSELNYHCNNILRLDEYNEAETCINIIEMINSEKRFFQYYCEGRYPISEELSRIKLKNALTRILKNQCIKDKDKKIVLEQLEYLHIYQQIFLGHDEEDYFQWQLGEKPY